MLDISDDFLEMYGKYKAKVDYNILNQLKDKEDGKLILVTAITPLLPEKERPLHRLVWEML